MVEEILLFKFSDIFDKNFEVIGIIFVLRPIESEPPSLLGFLIYADVEKHRNNIEFHILKFMVSWNGILQFKYLHLDPSPLEQAILK